MTCPLPRPRWFCWISTSLSIHCLLSLNCYLSTGTDLCMSLSLRNGEFLWVRSLSPCRVITFQCILNNRYFLFTYLSVTLSLITKGLTLFKVTTHSHHTTLPTVTTQHYPQSPHTAGIRPSSSFEVQNRLLQFTYCTCTSDGAKTIHPRCNQQQCLRRTVCYDWRQFNSSFISLLIAYM